MNSNTTTSPSTPATRTSCSPSTTSPRSCGPRNTVRWWRQKGTGPEFFKIGRRLYTTVGDLRRFIRKQRLASQPVIGKPKAV